MYLLCFSSNSYECCDFCKFCWMNVVVIDDADRTAIGYVCLWEGTSTGAKFLQIFRSCYHMVRRYSDVSLSKYADIIMENVHDNNRKYCVAVQGIDQKNPVLIRSYVFILRYNTYYMTGNV